MLRALKSRTLISISNCYPGLLVSSPMSTTTSSSSSTRKNPTSDIISNLSNLLPTGSFLAFQAVAPLFTNNGDCGRVEKIMTGLLILIFSIINFILSFTDSITTTSGKHYYGLVTGKGMYNPQFKGSKITGVVGSFYTGDKSKSSIFDFINGVLGVVVFDTLVLLTPPVSSCYYPHLPSTILKSVPILIGIVAGVYFSFAPPPRRGVGYSIAGLVTESVGDDETAPVSDGTTPQAAESSAKQSLLSTSQKKAANTSAAPADAKSPV